MKPPLWNQIWHLTRKLSGSWILNFQNWNLDSLPDHSSVARLGQRKHHTATILCHSNKFTSRTPIDFTVDWQAPTRGPSACLFTQSYHLLVWLLQPNDITKKRGDEIVIWPHKTNPLIGKKLIRYTLTGQSHVAVHCDKKTEQTLILGI